MQKEIEHEKINPFEQETEEVCEEEIKYQGELARKVQKDDINLNRAKLERVDLPHYHLYTSRNELEVLKGKKERLDNRKKMMTMGSMDSFLDEYERMAKSIEDQEAEAFRDWTLEEYKKFCEASQTYQTDDYHQIANAIKTKSFKDVKKYSRAFFCLLYTSPSPRDQRGSRMPSSA